MNNFPRYVSYNEPIRAQHINSIIDTLRKIQPVAGANVSIDQGSFGTRINAQPKSVAGSVNITDDTYPFKVRWYSTGENKGEWQIFLPMGCVSLTQSYSLAKMAESENTVTSLCINDVAKDKDDKEILQWYKIPYPEQGDAEVGEYQGYVARQWTVRLLMKPYPRFKVTTKKEDTDFKKAQWVYNVATLFECDVPGEGGKVNTTHGVTQLRRTYIEEEINFGDTFCIIYEMDSDAKDADYKVYLSNQEKFVGRAQLSIDEDTDIKGWKSVWLKIKHNAEKSEMEIVSDLSGSETVSDDDKTVFKIYELEDDMVIADYREDVPSFPFYSNGPDAPAETSENQSSS